MNEELKQIKKLYGEKMMHLCRSLFPTLLEQEGLLSTILYYRFAPSKFLYDDLVEGDYIEDFKNYILYLAGDQKEKVKTDKTPAELLSEVGYDLYECYTEEDIQSFKKYYAEDEELCTFNQLRCRSYHVFFAVKKNVDEIKRENFPTPKRQDEYGTSVISIQFTKGATNTLSIKNRYNHTVTNPDATFGNNLDNIVPGLTYAFEKKYDLDINQNDQEDIQLDNYVRADGGKLYKYNCERMNVYYCPNNIIIDHFKVKQYDKERYIVLDYFILDMKEKTIKTYDSLIFDSFVDDLQDIEKISVTNLEDGKKRIELLTTTSDTIIIEIDKTNSIIKYVNKRATKITDNFLKWNSRLEELELPNVISIGNYFLFSNINLNTMNLSSVIKIGDNFLTYNEALSKIECPMLKQVGSYFVSNNTLIDDLNLPELRIVGNNFLYECRNMTRISLPNLVKVAQKFLYNNEIIDDIDFPLLNEADSYFMPHNKVLTKVGLPSIRIIGSNFMYYNKNICVLEMPNIIMIRDGFLYSNEALTSLNLPEVTTIGDFFLNSNKGVSMFDAPNLRQVGARFMFMNEELRSVDFPKLSLIARGFLVQNEALEVINLPSAPLEAIKRGLLPKTQQKVALYANKDNDIEPGETKSI